MPNVSKLRRTFEAIIEGEGCEVLSFEVAKRGHLKFIVAAPGLGPKTFFTACSPSDARGIKNFRGDVRRWARGSTK